MNLLILVAALAAAFQVGSAIPLPFRAVAAARPAPAATRHRRQPLPPGTRIRLNTATADELRRLPGIGPRRADLIVEARARRPFRSARDLRRIKGFGAKTAASFAPWLDFGDGPGGAPARR